MKPLSPSEQQRRLYSRQLAAHTFRQWYAAQAAQTARREDATIRQTQTTSSESDSNGKNGADERPPDGPEQDNNGKKG